MHIIIQFSIHNFSIAKEDNIQNNVEEVITSIFSILLKWLL